MSNPLPFVPTAPMHRLAEIIRRQCNAHVGILSRGGLHSWLGFAQSVDRPECVGECRIAYRDWFASLSSSVQGTTLACPAGLSAMAVPVIVQGDCVAAVFASGLARDCAGPVRRIVSEVLTEIATEMREGIAAPEASTSEPTGIVANAECSRRLVRQVQTASGNDAPVLVTGAAGTGKDRVARQIHECSARRAAPFVAQNCAVLSAEELGSELFGHRRGAFPDAFTDRQGLLDIANHGTFYLDDVDRLPPDVQLRMVGLMQDGMFVPMGDIAPHAVDVRIVASTRVDLRDSVARGEFREDLYSLLCVQEIAVPPLADRIDDIGELAQVFLAVHAARSGTAAKTLSGDALDALRAYSWPGNVRELESEIARLCLACPQPCIDASQLSRRIVRGGLRAEATDAGASPGDYRIAPGQNIQTALEEIERNMIRSALRENDGNRTRTAEALGISRRNLIRKIESLRISE